MKHPPHNRSRRSRRISSVFLTLAVAVAGIAISARAATAQTKAPTAAPAPAPARTVASTFRAPAGSNLVVVTARDYNFDLPATIPAGLTTFRLLDRGREPHHFYLVRVDEGKNIADVMAALAPSKDAPTQVHAFPAWMHPVGGPNAPLPGGESNATVLLRPGSYVAFCVIPSPDGLLHLMKGMIRAFTVTGPAKATALPKPDLTITLSDYAFGLSQPLEAGRQTVAVTNTSAQPHELVLTRFPEGQSASDLVDWARDPHGRPPPGQPYGGVTDIPPGATVDVQLDLEPGRYGLICFSPDAKDGMPHAMHGMLKDIVVR
jgi:hypothetical protein